LKVDCDSRRSARPWRCEYRTAGLLAIELDDQLLLNRQRDVGTARPLHHPSGTAALVDRQPVDFAGSGLRLERRLNREDVLALRGQLDLVTGLHLEARHVNLAAIDLDVAVTNDLPRLLAGGRKAHPVYH